MSTSNRDLAQRWMDGVWNERRDEVVHELLHPDAVGHMEGGDVRGHDEFKNVRASLLQAFPDLQLTVDDMVCEGDHVVVRWRIAATHKGSGFGVAATGRKVAFRGMTWMTFSNGVLAEGWDSWNQGALLQQLSTTRTLPRI
jgi:steroid delta-isomerase-like uncharacterized protein